jgi:hypothetical protein
MFSMCGASAAIIEQLQLSARAGSSLADFSTLKMEMIRSFETSVYTISARRHIPEDGVLHLVLYFNILYIPDILVLLPWNKKTKLHGLSPQAKYTDRATAACRRS